MKRTLWLLALAAVLGSYRTAWAQFTYDYTATTQFARVASNLNLTAARRSDLEAAIRSEQSSVSDIFEQERTDIYALLTLPQREIYERYINPRIYYPLALMTPAEFQAYHKNMGAHLLLTPAQLPRYLVIQEQTFTLMTPVQERFEQDLEAILTPVQLSAFHTDVSGFYVAMAMQPAAVVQETVTQTTVIKKQTSYAVKVRQKTNKNWRNQDLK